MADLESLEKRIAALEQTIQEQQTQADENKHSKNNDISIKHISELLQTVSLFQI